MSRKSETVPTDAKCTDKFYWFSFFQRMTLAKVYLDPFLQGNFFQMMISLKYWAYAEKNCWDLSTRYLKKKLISFLKCNWTLSCSCRFASTCTAPAVELFLLVLPLGSWVAGAFRAQAYIMPPPRLHPRRQFLLLHGPRHKVKTPEMPKVIDANTFQTGFAISYRIKPWIVKNAISSHFVKLIFRQRMSHRLTRAIFCSPYEGKSKISHFWPRSSVIKLHFVRAATQYLISL